MTSSLIASAMMRDPLYHIECLTAPSYTKYLILSLPANLLGFLLGRKRDFHEIGHLCHLPAVSKFDATLNKRSARPGRIAAIRGVGQILAPDPAPPRSPNPASSPTPTGTPAPPASRPTPAP